MSNSRSVNLGLELQFLRSDTDNLLSRPRTAKANAAVQRDLAAFASVLKINPGVSGQTSVCTSRMVDAALRDTADIDIAEATDGVETDEEVDRDDTDVNALKFLVRRMQIDSLAE